MSDPTKPTRDFSGPGKRYHIVDEDGLRRLIDQLSPEIARETDRMGDLIRELVKLERTKLGLDQPRGTIELCPNQKKTRATDPDLIGQGRVAGRSYRAAAWLAKPDKLKIALLPLKSPKNGPALME